MKMIKKDALFVMCLINGGRRLHRKRFSLAFPERAQEFIDSGKYEIINVVVITEGWLQL